MGDNKSFIGISDRWPFVRINLWECSAQSFYTELQTQIEEFSDQH